METDGLLAILVVVALRRVADRPLCWQRGYTDPFLPSLFPFLRTSKWKPQARPIPVSPYQSPPPGAFLEVGGGTGEEKKAPCERAANPVLAAGASHVHRISCSKGN